MTDPSQLRADSPIFLSYSQVLAIHEHQIATYGGGTGIRDRGMIESAIAQPRQRYAEAYLHPDLAAMAGAYLFHLVSNHGFIDGNKRTGVHVAIVFLALNGFELQLDLDAAYSLTMRIASHQVTKEEVIDQMRAWLRADG